MGGLQKKKVKNCGRVTVTTILVNTATVSISANRGSYTLFFFLLVQYAKRKTTVSQLQNQAVVLIVLS